MADATAGDTQRSGWPELLQYFGPGLYRTNVYRLTGLPFEAGAEQLTATLNGVLTAKSLMPIEPALTPEEAAAANFRVADAETLLLDQFFWLWSRPGPKDGRDKPLEALARGAWLDAAELWRVQLQQPNNDGIALHNLAVLFHAMALDLEFLARGGPLTSRQVRQRDAWWKESFSAWRAVREHTVFWRAYRDQLAGRLPGTSHLGFAESLRAHLLSGIASVHGRMAERCHSVEDEWDRQLALIEATGYGLADLLHARALAAAPLVRIIGSAVTEAPRQAMAKADRGLLAATRLLEHSRPPLARLARIMAPAAVNALSDEVALGSLSCIDAFGKATGGWSALLPTAEAALQLAHSPEVRTRVNKHLLAFRTNYSSQVHQQRGERLAALRSQCAAILTSSEPAHRRLAELFSCERRDLRELLTAASADQALQAEATGVLVHALRQFRTSIGADQGSVLLALDALSQAESLALDTRAKTELAAERAGLVQQLRERQSAESSRVGGSHPLLTQLGRPELYVQNAFRLTGLSTLASERELTRHVQKLEMAERLGALNPSGGGPLSVAPLDVQGLRDSVQRVQDIEHRLLDEFFWIWPLPGYSMEPGAASSEIASDEQLTDAKDAWTRAAALNLDHGISAHNLAVLNHSQALDLELRQRTVPLSTSERSLRDQLWTKAFGSWTVALDTPALWQHLRERIGDLADPRLDSSMAARIRNGLPTTLLSTAVRLAIQVHGKNRSELKRLTDLVVSSGFPRGAIGVAAKPLIERIRQDLARQVSDADHLAEKTPDQGHIITRGLMSEAWASLLALTSLLGDEDPVVSHEYDAIALASLGCVSHYARHSKDWPEVLATLKQVELLARGPSARETIHRNVKTAEGNLIFDRAKADLDGLSKQLEDIANRSTTPKERLAQLRGLVEASIPLFDHPEYLSDRGDVFARCLQQFAIRVNNESEEYDVAMEALRLALTLCAGTELQRELADGRRAVSRNADGAALTNRCRVIGNGVAAPSEKLHALGLCAQEDLQAIKQKYTDDAEFVAFASDAVASAVRSASIDLCNNSKEFKAALSWLRFAASIAKGVELRERLEKDIIVCQGLVDRFGASLPVVVPKSSSCFVATAAYGSPDADEVVWLRLYRDLVLSSTPWGRALIRAYNATSPPVALWVRHGPLLRTCVRACLGPVARWCREQITRGDHGRSRY